MAERIWDQYLTDEDREVFNASGFGSEMGLEEMKRPALLVIDVNYDFCGDRDEPILDSIKRWRLSCGPSAWRALPVLKKLIKASRAKGLPVIYTTGMGRADGWDKGSWMFKSARKRKAGGGTPPPKQNRDGNDIMDEIAPEPEDLVISKIKPSGFFDTPLESFLTLLGADSVIVTGTTTSGCVRGTVIDAFSYNYRIAVVEDGCFDRAPVAHAINLADMHAKYADVVPCDTAIEFIESLPDGLFELPKGA